MSIRVGTQKVQGLYIFGDLINEVLNTFECTY